MTPTTATLRVHPISPTELDDVRSRRLDRFGNVPEEFASKGGDQIRCCLRHSEPGERLWVISHAPLTAARPWREVGPVFVHREPCQGYDSTQGLPAFINGKPRVLRSYTADQKMHYAGNRVTSSEDDLTAVLQTLLIDPHVAEVHIRNLEAQCFIARVTL
jgi:hypothetical protein